MLSPGPEDTWFLKEVVTETMSWFTQRQTMVATFTTKAKSIAASEAVKELICLIRLCEDIWRLKYIPVL